MSLKTLINSIEDPSLLVYSERLNHALDLALWPQDKLRRAKQLANMFKVDSTIAFGWLNGIARPEKKMSDKISAALKVNGDWLQSGIGVPTIGKHTDSGLVSLPQLTLSEISNVTELLKEKTWVRERFAVMTECSPSSFVVYVGNELLSPVFPNDTHFVVDPRLQPNDGDYVLAKTSQGILCGTYITDDDAELFMPLNSNRQLRLSKRDKIIGVILEATTKFL